MEEHAVVAEHIGGRVATDVRSGGLAADGARSIIALRQHEANLLRTLLEVRHFLFAFRRWQVDMVNKLQVAARDGHPLAYAWQCAVNGSNTRRRVCGTTERTDGVRTTSLLRIEQYTVVAYRYTADGIGSEYGISRLRCHL